MAVTLDSTISRKPRSRHDAAMLDHLQANILKPHTRDFMALLFLQFKDAAGGRKFLRGLSAHVKSTSAHLEEIEKFKAKKSVPGKPYLGVGLTAPGYAALGVAKVPADPSFRRGMQKADLNDPDVKAWDPHFRKPGDLHAVVVIGDTMMEPMHGLFDEVVARINASKGVVVLGTQDGLGLHNANGDGIEHFGYVDGRSQPLYFTEDIDAETMSKDGTSTWNPAFPLRHAIVPDPAAPDPTVHFGSYFVFRKLEQNVKLFKEEEKEFAEALKLEDDERAGTMLVGRFEDGTPVTMQSAEGAHHPVPNNFDYGSDHVGGKCPFFGHIRKMNPRNDDEEERSHLMPRRGQTYGVRVDNPNDGETKNKPQGNVGLLFMAFNSDIGRQFEFTQKSWANDVNFPTKGAGVDPIIGQMPHGKKRPRVKCPVGWGSAEPGKSSVAQIPQTVTMKGGEYFFMPSLAFLRSL